MNDKCNKTKNAQGTLLNSPKTIMVVMQVFHAGMSCWSVMLECHAGMSCWSVMLECHAGMSCWSVMLECHAGMSCWDVMLGGAKTVIILCCYAPKTAYLFLLDI